MYTLGPQPNSTVRPKHTTLITCNDMHEFTKTSVVRYSKRSQSMDVLASLVLVLTERSLMLMLWQVQDNYCRSDGAPVVGCFYHDNGSRYFNTTGMDTLEVDFSLPCVGLLLACVGFCRMCMLTIIDVCQPTKGNVAEISPAPCVYLQGCCNAPALDCHVSSLYCRGTAPVRNGCAVSLLPSVLSATSRVVSVGSCACCFVRLIRGGFLWTTSLPK